MRFEPTHQEVFFLALITFWCLREMPYLPCSKSIQTYRSIQHKHQPLAGSGISTLIHQLHSIISFSSLIDVRDILSGERGWVCYRFVRFSTCSNYSFRLKSAKTRNMWLVLIQSITLYFFHHLFFNRRTFILHQNHWCVPCLHYIIANKKTTCLCTVTPKCVHSTHLKIS